MASVCGGRESSYCEGIRYVFEYKIGIVFFFFFTMGSLEPPWPWRGRQFTTSLHLAGEICMAYALVSSSDLGCALDPIELQGTFQWQAQGPRDRDPPMFD